MTDDQIPSGGKVFRDLTDEEYAAMVDLVNRNRAIQSLLEQTLEVFANMQKDINIEYENFYEPIHKELKDKGIEFTSVNAIGRKIGSLRAQFVTY